MLAGRAQLSLVRFGDCLFIGVMCERVEVCSPHVVSESRRFVSAFPRRKTSHELSLNTCTRETPSEAYNSSGAPVSLSLVRLRKSGTLQAVVAVCARSGHHGNCLKYCIQGPVKVNLGTFAGNAVASCIMVLLLRQS